MKKVSQIGQYRASRALFQEHISDQECGRQHPLASRALAEVTKMFPTNALCFLTLLFFA
jgi:hypothetical protein